MAVTDVIDGAGTPREFKVSGAGSTGDPFIAHFIADELIPGTAATDLGKAEDAAHVTGDTGVMALTVRKDTAAATATTDGDYQPPVTDASGRLWVNAGAVTPGTAAGNLGKAEDAAHTSGDTGVMALAVRNDAGGALATSDGDYIPLSTDSSGALRITSTGGGGVSANVAGDVAHDAVDSGDPVKIGGYAKTTAPTAVSADGDRVNAWFDLAGRLAIHDGAGNLSIDDGGNNISIDDGGNLISIDDGGSSVSIDDGGGTLSIDDGAGSITIDGSVTADTELPSAAALADGESNPTAPAVGSHLLFWNGASWDRVRAANKGYDMSAVSITSIATVGTPTSGKKMRVMSGSFSVSAACSVLFEDNAGGTTVFRTPKLLADTPYNFDLGAGYLLAAANNVLKATASAAASITGTIRATEE